MKKQILIFIVLPVLIFGCTSTRFIDQSSRITYFEEINKAANGRKAHIVLSNGQEFTGFDIRITPDSTSWADSSRVITQTFPTSEIQEIIFIKRGKGALQGLGWGILSGAVLVSAISAIAYSREYDENDDLTPAEVGAFFGVTVGIPVGATIGLIGGAAIGSKERYVINRPRDVDSNKK